MSDEDEIFGTAFNWCDSWCDRCALRERCPIVRIERQRRWVHEAKGEDPDDAGVVMEDVEKDLERAMKMLAEHAEREGIDLSDLDSMDVPPMPIAALRLQRTGMSYSLATKRALEQLPDELPPDEDAQLDELIHQSTVIARKCARLGGYVDRTGGPIDDPEVWILDAVPNLLLMEIVLQRARAAVDALLSGELASGFHALHADLDRSLAPLYAAIPKSARDELAARVAKNDAPSPFCVEPAVR